MTHREPPYVPFNFAIHIDSGMRTAAFAGFQECSGISLAPEPVSERGKTASKRRVTKITGINKATDVTLKRGVVSAPALNAWLKEVRDGKKKPRDVTLVLQSDDGSKSSRKWKLVRARIIKHTSGPLNAKGTDVAMEELVISCEKIEPV